MKILPNGYFSFEFSTAELSKGLRPSAKLPRNNKFLTECKGAIGQDGTLVSLPQLAVNSIFDNELIELDNFPFPQVFTTEKLIIVCNETSILEVVDDTLTLMITVPAGGGLWGIVSSYDYLYLCNDDVVVVRNAESKTYTLNTTLPKTSALCNCNGQIFVGGVGLP